MGIALQKLPGVFDPLPGGKVVVNAVDYVVNWARANSLWPLVYGTSCCAIEMMAAGGSHQDWSRFGVEVARATPRQADLIILAGTIVEKLAPRLVTLYEQMPAPKYVIAMGACAVSGGPFYYDSYSVVKGADRLIPVDVFIPGCPPRPEALLYGIMKLQDKIRRDSIRHPRLPRPVFNLPIENTFSETAKEWAAEEKVRQDQLKEAQEKFKAENPDFKPYRQPRVQKPDLPELEHEPRALPGTPAAELFSTIQGKFPTIEVHNVPEATPEKIAELGPEYVLDLALTVEQYLPVINFMKHHATLDLDFLIELTAVDWETHFDIVAHFASMAAGHKVFVRCKLPRENSEITSLATTYLTADWHEREVYDLFGIKFTGHPDLRRIFLEDDFPGHPFRKDFIDETRVVKRPY